MLRDMGFLFVQHSIPKNRYMKKIILLVILCTAALYANAQKRTEILEVKTDSLKTDDFISIENKTYKRYISEKVEAETFLKLRILAANAASKVSIVRSPSSIVHRFEIVKDSLNFAGKDIDVQLHKDEDVDYEVTIVDTNRNTFKYIVTLSTNTPYKPNANFIFLSAIRSVAGTARASEFFDINLKFNYLGNMFTLFGLDLSLSPTQGSSNDTTQLKVNEGLATVNIFFHTREMLSSGLLNRAMFFGGGVKIFNRQPYLGVHLGSLEINGPLFSSYLTAGYYRNAYGRYVTTWNDSLPLNFRNNFYTECTLAFDNKKDVAGILSDIRLKLGIMSPFTHSDKDIVKPLAKDVQYRIVLEVPIGGIYKFGGTQPKTDKDKTSGSKKRKIRYLLTR